MLRFPRLLHTSVQHVVPGRVVEEPIYHLAHLIGDVEERRARAVGTKSCRPGLDAPGGGPFNPVFYVPEDWAVRVPAEVPAHHHYAIVAGLAGREVSGSVPGGPVVTAAENDRLWAGAPLEPGDLAALTPVNDDHRLAPGEAGEVLVRLTNQGGAVWPWGLDQPPFVRPAHRWLHLDGTPLGPDHPRQALPCTIGPGATEVVPLRVHAPALPGEYILDVDVVHEGVAWCGCGLRIPVTVAGRGDPAVATPMRLPARRRGRRGDPGGGGGEMVIPSVLHRVLLGTRELPAEQVAFGEGWPRYNPGWRVRLWGDSDVEALVSDPESFARCRNLSERSDVLRYEILRRFGGAYADTNVECLRPLAPLLDGVTAFAGYEAHGRLGTALIGMTASHPLAVRAVSLLRRTIGTGTYPNSTAPVFFTAASRTQPDLVRFPREAFYPYGYDEPHHRDERFLDAYAVHHWAQTWG